MMNSKMTHRVKCLSVLIGMSMLTACGSDTEQNGVNWNSLERISQSASRAEDRVAVQQLAKWIIESKQDYQLIDIRDSKSFQERHIVSAANIPMTKLTTPDIQEHLAGKKVIVYSNGSENAAKAAVMLRLMGIDGYLLTGGFNAWQQHVLNPDISEHAVDDELPQVALQRAISCHFKGGGAHNHAEEIKPVEIPKPAFTPPVFTPPAAPGGLIVDEGC